MIIVGIQERIGDFFGWIKSLIEKSYTNVAIEREVERNKYAFLKCKSDISKLPRHLELSGEWVYLGDVLNLIDYYMGDWKE